MSSAVVPSDAELLQAQADLYRQSLYYLTPMALRCAVELGIPTAIHRLGGAATAADLAAALSLPSARLPFLRRLLRLLAASGVFASDDKAASAAATYRISPVSYLLVDGVRPDDDDRHISHTSFVLAATSARYVDAAMAMAGWFRKADDVLAGAPPFEHLHGATLFHESMESLDADFHGLAAEALQAHDNLGVEIAMREFRDVFQGISSVTYCCGAFGDDKFARVLVKAFPHIRCTVLGGGAGAGDAAINYVQGDMFSFVPPAQAVVLKLVLHHWTDEDCVKILSQCRKAVPPREDGGKVLVGDIVIDYSDADDGGAMLEMHLLMDVGMMTMTKGRQRDESEWRQIFKEAGFSDYKFLKKFGARGVFEVYP